MPVASIIPDQSELQTAESRLRGLIRRTPILELTGPDLDELRLSGRVVLKLELQQHVGVFKARLRHEVAHSE